MDGKNKLYFGDNLGILREHVTAESTDRIYLDPPFNSSATYNVLFKEKSGEESAVQFRILKIAELLVEKKIQFPERRFEIFAKVERKTRHQQEELF